LNSYTCSKCGFTTDKPLLRCPYCGSILHYSHGFEWSIDWSRQGIYRFHRMLPSIGFENSLGEGFTPLVESFRVSRDIGVKKLYFKNEGCNPTGSFRDRVAALLTSHAHVSGYKKLVCATDGNLGASLSAYSSRLGLEVEAYVPRGCDWGKIVLMKSFGASIIEHGECLDDVYSLVYKKAVEENLYNATSEANALSIEALKTIALEIYYQLGGIPDHVFIPVGSGLTLYSIHHGFRELLENHVVDRIPCIHGVETCWNPRISRLMGYSVKECIMEAIIGLAYHYPPLEKEAVDVIRETNASIWVVGKKEVYRAGEELARREGLFVEPAAAVAYAGYRKAVEEGSIDPSDTVVVLLTGHGLKAFEGYGVKLKTRRRASVFPSETKLEILRVISSREPIHGYRIWRELGLDISMQAVYQHLKSLEKTGLITSRVIDNRRYYFLTDKGRMVLELLNHLLK